MPTEILETESNMNRTSIAVASAVVCIAVAGCQSYRPNTVAGGLLGSTTGGLMGAAIGSSEGKSGEGALIGALAGGVTGAALGNQADQANLQQEQLATQKAMMAQQAAVTFEQVIQMSQSGLSDEVIINQIQSSGIARRPTTNDLIQLKNSGLNDSVIGALQSTRIASAQNFAPPNSYPPSSYSPNPTIYVDRQYVPVCPAPPVIYRPIPHRYPHRYAGRGRAGFAVQF